jgi:hypothetical protein
MNAYVRQILALFATLMGSQATVGPSAHAQEAAAQDPEAREWQQARAAGTQEALEAYLARHPAGRYSREAFRMIIAGSASATSDIPVCSDIGAIDPALAQADPNLASCVAIGALY